MTERQDTSTDHLTFSQRYGYEPLPEPMRLEDLSGDLRREIWNAIRELLNEDSHSLYSDSYYFGERTKKFIERVIGKFLRQSEDEISTDYSQTMFFFEDLVHKGEFNRVLDLVQIIVNERDETDILTERIKNSFEQYAAYWLNTSHRPFQFYPRSSIEQGEATQNAIETIRESGMEGASTHLRQATGHINARRFADSVKESIHAVESVARRIDQKAHRTLDPALDSLKGAGILKHPALAEAFKKLYGYTSDEQGIRHALLDKETPDVGLDEALFMFGACASFAAYLVNKHRQMT